MRGTKVWNAARGARDVAGAHACAAIHAGVTAAPHLVPLNLRLKHEYDYRTVKVDPARITGMLKVGHWRKRSGDGPASRLVHIRDWQRLGGGWKNAQRHISRNIHGQFVVGGTWDLECRPFEIRPSARQMFLEGLPPHETDEYQNILERINAREFKWTRGCYSVEDLDRYFARHLRLFEEISANGYRSQADLGLDGADEIRVCVDRSGRLMVFGGGTHRLSIVKLLEIETVPVIVKRVHATWVSTRLQQLASRDPIEAISHGLAELGDEDRGGST